MNFQSFYGISRNPFDKQQCTEKDFFNSHDFEQMSSRLNVLKDIRGIGVFTAAPGMGKSFALRCFAKNLNPNMYHMEYICLSTVSVADFYKEFCQVLGLPERGSKTSMFKAIKDQVFYLYKEKRQPLLLAVDEAQYLSTGILNDIKMLMNQDYDSINCFTLILCGESYLQNTLRKPVHEALNQRITIRYNFEGLSDEEVPAYIRHKLSCAGAPESLVDEPALSAVHGYAHGNVRIIDNIMSDALIIGAQMEHSVIDAEVILAAIHNQDPFA